MPLPGPATMRCTNVFTFISAKDRFWKRVWRPLGVPTSTILNKKKKQRQKGSRNVWANDFLIDWWFQNKGGHDILRKLLPKWIPKAIKIEAQTVPRSEFWVLGATWRIRNLDVFRERKKWTNNLIQIRNLKLWNKKTPGAAEGADRAEALESVSSRVSIWHASSSERGRRILWATASSAGLRI